MKKFVAMSTAILLVATTIVGAGCAKGQELRDDITYISIRLPYGGVGSAWAEEVAKEYEELNKNKSFEDGKTGVDVLVEQAASGATTLYTTDTYDMVVTNAVGVQDFIMKGLLLDVSDLYTKESAYDGLTINEKVENGAVNIVRGSNGTIYGVPYYQGYGGLSYNREVFNKHGLFFAKGDGGVEVKTNYGTARFVTKNQPVTEGEYPCTLSDGPDHEAGTEDDGLPSTLQELAILCSWMKSCRVQPITFTYEHKAYANNLVNGLWISLAGYDAMQTFYSYKGGPVKIVTGEQLNPDTGMAEIDWSNDSLLPGLKSSYVKKPDTTWTNVTMDTGYLVDEMAAKYYAMAFLEIGEKEGFYADMTYNTISHWDTQLAFIAGGYSTATATNPEIGMLAEETFWWNEAEANGRLAQYENLSAKKAEDLDVRFMPLPTALDEDDIADKEAQYALMGKEYDWSNTMMASAIYSSILVCKQAATGGQGHLNAVYDFLDYLTSKQALKTVNESIGMSLPYKNYYEKGEVACENKSKFSASLAKLEADSKIIYVGSDSELYRQVFNDSRRLSCYTYAYSTAGIYPIVELRSNNKSMQSIFNQLRQSPAQWESTVSGYLE